MTKEYEAYLPSELFFFQAEDGIRDRNVTGVQTCALPIWSRQCGRGDEHAYSAGMRRRASDKRHLLHAGPAFVGRRWLELTQCAHLRGGRKHAGLEPGERSQLLGRRQRAVHYEQSRDAVEVGLRERRLDPPAA